MKNLIAFSLIIGLLGACTSVQKKSANIDSNKLIGLYEVDISPLFKNLKDGQNDSNGVESFIGGLALLALNTVDVNIEFINDHEAKLFVEGDVIELDAMINGETIRENKIDYRIKNDSILMVKNFENNEYEYWATIKTDNGNYSKLKLLINNKDIGKVQLNLLKISE